MERFYTVLAEILNNRVIQIVMIAVVFDTIFGVIRAVREHKFNSCFGIDGAIRKISMIVSITMLAIVDRLVKINLIGFVPEEARQFIGLEIIGTAEHIINDTIVAEYPIKVAQTITKSTFSDYINELIQMII